MIDKNEDRSLFVLLLHLFLDIKYQISDIEYQISQNTQTRRRQYWQDCNHTATYYRQHITDKIVD